MNLLDQLSEISSNLEYVKVESTLILGAILLLITGLVNKSNWLIKSVYGATLILAFYFNWQGFPMGTMLSNSLLSTSMAHNFTAILLLAALLILVYSRSNEHATEFYFFILSILAGSIFIMKANSFLVAYISIELTSFSAYILTNFSFKKNGFEAGIKYLLFGAVSTAIMLFGFGLIYGTTGAFFLSDLSGLVETPLLNVGLIFVIFGILFKASIVPFHIWVPATYQSAPNDAIAILSIVPKLSALVLLNRLLLLADTEVGDLLTTLCLILGMITIVFGTLSALNQANARRMISFGAIAHSGFLLPLAIMDTSTSDQAFWWYAVIYSLMNIAVFRLLDEYETNEIVEVNNYSGIGTTNWVVNSSMTMVLVSLIGLPPLAGFTAKFFLFSSLWEYFSLTTNAVYMAYLIVAIFATIISLFFYLRIPYRMFLVNTETFGTISSSVSTKIIATLFSIILLLLFFAPQILTVMQQLLNSHIAYE